jgi:hypothetical protein
MNKINIYIHFGQKLGVFTFQLRDFRAQQITIEIKTYCVNMSALFGSEDISRSANFQVAQGQPESRSEMSISSDGA